MEIEQRNQEYHAISESHELFPAGGTVINLAEFMRQTNNGTQPPDWKAYAEKRIGDNTVFKEITPDGLVRTLSNRTGEWVEHTYELESGMRMLGEWILKVEGESYRAYTASIAMVRTAPDGSQTAEVGSLDLANRFRAVYDSLHPAPAVVTPAPIPAPTSALAAAPDVIGDIPNGSEDVLGGQVDLTGINLDDIDPGNGTEDLISNAMPGATPNAGANPVPDNQAQIAYDETIADLEEEFAAELYVNHQQIEELRRRLAVLEGAQGQDANPAVAVLDGATVSEEDDSDALYAAIGAQLESPAVELDQAANPVEDEPPVDPDAEVDAAGSTGEIDTDPTAADNNLTGARPVVDGAHVGVRARIIGGLRSFREGALDGTKTGGTINEVQNRTQRERDALAPSDRSAGVRAYGGTVSEVGNWKVGDWQSFDEDQAVKARQAEDIRHQDETLRQGTDRATQATKDGTKRIGVKLTAIGRRFKERVNRGQPINEDVGDQTTGVFTARNVTPIDVDPAQDDFNQRVEAAAAAMAAERLTHPAAPGTVQHTPSADGANGNGNGFSNGHVEDGEHIGAESHTEDPFFPELETEQQLVLLGVAAQVFDAEAGIGGDLGQQPAVEFPTDEPGSESEPDSDSDSEPDTAAVEIDTPTESNTDAEGGSGFRLEDVRIIYEGRDIHERFISPKDGLNKAIVFDSQANFSLTDRGKETRLNVFNYINFPTELSVLVDDVYAISVIQKYNGDLNKALPHIRNHIKRRARTLKLRMPNERMDTLLAQVNPKKKPVTARTA